MLFLRCEVGDSFRYPYLAILFGYNDKKECFVIDSSRRFSTTTTKLCSYKIYVKKTYSWYSI